MLWVELWLRAVRHPELRPTAAKLYARMHDWFREAIEEGDFGPVDADAIADRTLALIDGYGVRALLGDPAMPLERAREEVWHALAGDLGLHPAPDRLGSLNRRSDNSGMSPRPTTAHVRRPAILKAAAEVIAERGVIGTRIGDVAERADTSAPGVLYWFATKDELLAEALAFCRRPLLRRAERRARAAGGARGRGWRGSSSCGPPTATTRPCCGWSCGCARCATRRSPARASGWTGAGARRSPTWSARARRPASSRPVDPDEFALTLGALMDGFAIQLALRDPAVTPDSRARALHGAGGGTSGTEGVHDAI